MKAIQERAKRETVAIVAAIASTMAACVGPPGPEGPPGAMGTMGTAGVGHNSLVRTTAEPVSGNCATGGVRIETGVDLDDSGTLDATEVNPASTAFVCSGAAGVDGPPGPPGSQFLYQGYLTAPAGDLGTGGTTLMMDLGTHPAETVRFELALSGQITSSISYYSPEWDGQLQCAAQNTWINICEAAVHFPAGSQQIVFSIDTSGTTGTQTITRAAASAWAIVVD